MRSTLISIILLITGLIFGQKSNELSVFYPATPETYQFQKRIDNDVSLYTGQPQINIPIYTIKLDNVELPISLSYQTGGIKVEEEASTVGLGWNLNVGGEIVRNQHGAPDERGILQYAYNDINKGISRFAQTADLNNSEEFNYRNSIYTLAVMQTNPFNVYQDQVDFRPDEFYYSILGQNGKFMYSQNLNKFITFPLEDIQISYALKNGSSAYDKRFDQISLKLTNGLECTFGYDARRVVSNSSHDYEEAWLIKNIQSPLSNRSISFEYINSNYMDYSLPAIHYDYFRTPLYQHISTVVGCVDSYSSVMEDYKTFNKTISLPSTVRYSGGRIEFIYGDNREDLSTGAKKLDEINVYSADRLLRKIKFTYSYFVSNCNLETSTGFLFRNKRLKLDKIEVFGNNSLDSPQVYTFDYYTFDKIPAISSFSKDHWGFFNGKTSNVNISSLIPKSVISIVEDEKNGGDRSIDTVYSKTFSLRKIVFPEGGCKQLYYENHRALINNTASYIYQKQLTDANYEIRNLGLGVSGYDLNTYIPAPTTIPFKGERIFYGESFEINSDDQNLPYGLDNIILTSTLPKAVPNYSNINSDYNYVEFFLEKKDANNQWKLYKSYGRINKDTESSMSFHYDLIPKGFYRGAIKLVQQYSIDPNNIYHYHASSLSIKFRHKVYNNLPSDILAGGLRIAKIETFESIKLNNKFTTYYEYKNDDGSCAGKLVNLPSYIQPVDKLYVYCLTCNSGPSTSHMPGFRISSEPTLPLNKSFGSNVGYTKVTEKKILNHDVIKKESFFSFKDSYLSELPENDVYRQFEPSSWHRGKLIKEKNFSNGYCVSEDIYNYNGLDIENDKGYVEEINTDLINLNDVSYSTVYCGRISNVYAISPVTSIGQNPETVLLPNQVPYFSIYGVNNTSASSTGCQKIPYFKIYTGFDKLSSKKTISYFQNGTIENVDEFFYQNVPYSCSLSTRKTYNSNTSPITIDYKYARDLNEEILISQNRVDIPLQSTTKKLGQIVNDDRTTYSLFGSLYLPSANFSKINGAVNTSLSNDRQITYDKYDLMGNIQQYHFENGIYNTILWSYNNQYPIAEIKNANYTDVAGALQGITPEQLAISMNPDMTKVDALRLALPNALITTYTHIPLVGIWTVKDPRGVITTYNYDSFNRLINITDNNGKVLKTFNYNYKQ